MDKTLPAVVVALGFLGLLAIVLVITLPRGGEDADTFLKVWAGVGTLVGVAAGAIPSYFFKRQADEANETATRALAALDPATAEAITRTA